MRESTQFQESNPRHHTQKLRGMLTDVINHAREDVGKVSDPKAQALFETAAEVLSGVRKAFQDFEERTEQAWKIAS